VTATYPWHNTNALQSNWRPVIMRSARIKRRTRKVLWQRIAARFTEMQTMDGIIGAFQHRTQEIISDPKKTEPC
jgi:hypothetical protein